MCNCFFSYISPHLANKKIENIRPHNHKQFQNWDRPRAICTTVPPKLSNLRRSDISWVCGSSSRAGPLLQNPGNRRSASQLGEKLKNSIIRGFSAKWKFHCQHLNFAFSFWTSFPFRCSLFQSSTVFTILKLSLRLPTSWGRPKIHKIGRIKAFTSPKEPEKSEWMSWALPLVLKCGHYTDQSAFILHA